MIICAVPVVSWTAIITLHDRLTSSGAGRRLVEVTVEQVRPVAVKGNRELCEPLAALVYYKTYDSEIYECWERLQ